jgi:TonB family protein
MRLIDGVIEFVGRGLYLGLRGLAAVGAVGWRALAPRLPRRSRRWGERLAAYFSAQDRIFRRSMLSSAVAHVVVLIAFTLSPGRSHELHWQTPVLPVSLITLPAPADPVPPQAASSKPKPVPKPAAKPPEKPKPKAPKLKQRVPTQPEPAPPRSEPAPVETLVAVPSVRRQLALNARAEETTFDYDYYLPTIAQRISAAWQPVAPGAAGPPSVTLRIRIQRDGRVSSVDVEEPSAVAAFDRSAADAVWAAQPLPRLPQRYEGEYLTVHLRFTYTG